MSNVIIPTDTVMNGTVHCTNDVILDMLRVNSSNVVLGYHSGLIAQGVDSVAIGVYAGSSSQGTNCVAIGSGAGSTSQQPNAISIGITTGAHFQGSNAVAIGSSAGFQDQGIGAVAIGSLAGHSNQGTNSVAIGDLSGFSNQGILCISIGSNAGYTAQSDYSVAIGTNAGLSSQGTNAIAIGANAGQSNQPSNSIIINASSNVINGLTSNACYVNPIREDSSNTQVLCYDATNYEITYNSSKTFVINHPVHENKYLVHACLEGPEAGVYYRGKSEIINGQHTLIYLPDYVMKLACNFTIGITPIGTMGSPNLHVYSASEVYDNGSFHVFGPNGKFYWLVHAQRLKINVEPEKTNVDVKGNGPYTYIVNK